jgi:hypothetical protein
MECNVYLCGCVCLRSFVILTSQQTVITQATAAFVVEAKGDMFPGLAAMALIYAINITNLLAWTVRSLAVSSAI